MFILRAAFWLTLVIFLIPGEPGSGSAGPRAGAIEAILAARGVIADVAGMCERQPDVCSNGGAALQAFGDKAKLGVALFNQAMDGKLAASVAQGVDSAARGTLRPEDVGAAWRAPAAGGKA